MSEFSLMQVFIGIPICLSHINEQISNFRRHLIFADSIFLRKIYNPVIPTIFISFYGRTGSRLARILNQTRF